jgi:hypothetical protein
MIAFFGVEATTPESRREQLDRSALPRRFSAILVLAFVLGLLPAAVAQTGGEGGIQGTVTDTTGAAIPNASIVATNVATSIKTKGVTTGAGLYNLISLIPGTYTITATANGFQSFQQDNVSVEALQTTGLNISLTVGSQSEEVTVTAAPPALDTTNATLGGSIESKEYMSLPLLVSGNQQRDITQFSNLLPGAQLNPAGRSSVIGGTQARLGEEYLDGLPLTSISQQGDNRPIFNVVPMESISEVQVVTSGFSAEFQGIGLENYTLGSGGNQYHGTVADFVRNTIFDAWGFAAPWSTVTNAKGVKGFQKDVGSKPVDHENELSASIGGPISIPHLFSGKDRLFFEATYDKLHSRSAPAYGFDTIPTTQMRTGDFSQLLAANGGPGLAIFDPTTQAACTAHSTSGPCRYQFGYGPGSTAGANGNPVPTGAPINVIPANEISPIAQYLQKFLPPTANSALTGNYLGGIPSGYDNYLWAGRIDYQISSRQKLSFAATDGRRHAVPFTSGTANLPQPYLAATLSTVVGDSVLVEHTFTLSPHMVNQLSAGYFYFGGPPVQNNTEGQSQWEATTAGITNLPAGQASDEFPGVTFAGTDGGTEWSQPDVTSKTVSHTYDIVDNFNWLLGKHSLTLGVQLQDLMENASSSNSYSSPITYAFNPNDTANLSGSSFLTTTGGFSDASFLLGAVNSASTTLQPFSDIGERFHTIAPYVQDDFKITPKLTVNVGLRWDYLPPYHEVLNRWSFLNPTLSNPYTGNLGSLQFAGNYGGATVSCGCTTPVQTWWKNWGPRVGFAYSIGNKTVIRSAVAILYTHGGGTGGASPTATGQTGFNAPNAVSEPGTASASSAPAFYLNNSAYFQGIKLANTNFGGPAYALIAPSTPSATTQLSTTQVGNFVNSSGAFVKSNAGISYGDPHYGGRTPTVYFFNFGIEQSLTHTITLTLNYAGTGSHFLAGASGLRGLQSNEINPSYFVLGSLLAAAATSANITKAQAILPNCCAPPYSSFTAAAGTSAGASLATIGQGLKWMPQYSGTTDTWGLYSANAAYNSLQTSLAIQPTRGLTLNINFTWSKELDDAGTIRTGFPIPAFANATGKAWAADRMDRSLSTLDVPYGLAAYGVYNLPFGRGHIGGNHFLVRAIAGGWQFSSILTYSSGYPLTLSSSACTSVFQPSQGTCMPDVNPSFSGPIMTSKWGKGATALNLGTTSYIRNGYVKNTVEGDGTDSSGNAVLCGSSSGPFCNPGNYMIGDAARTGAFGLRSPGNFRLNSGIRRDFPITERVKFTFGVDAQNVTNSVSFGVNAGNLQIPTGINSSNFGALTFATSDARAFQFSGRLTF